MDEYMPRPLNPRRRRKTKMEIFKEAYLPTIIMIATAIIILIFVIGSVSRRSDSAETTPPDTTPSTTAPTTDIHAEEAQRLLAEAALLAADYDYQGAANLIDSFSGDISSYPVLSAKKSEYLAADANMVTWTDPTQIKVLSFHGLIADPARAFVNKDYGAAYNRNFVTCSEFSKILQQLYDNGYILVSLDDFTVCEENADGQTQCQFKELRLPVGKKPLLLVQTNINYYTYMIDSNGDGTADKDGAGFASRMLVGADGKITCEMVDSEGNTVQGNYDLVPILNDFIAGHPDFSYRGAKAILAPSGYNGIFGYRIDAASKASKGDAYHNTQVAGATEIVNALRADGYELACYTYGNSAYGTLSAAEIQSDLRSWTNDITPYFGSTNILVFAQNSQIEEYTGGKFNVLQNAGFRYYLGFNTTSKVDSNYALINRIFVTGSQMTTEGHAQYSGLFDAASVLDPLRNQPSN